MLSVQFPLNNDVALSDQKSSHLADIFDQIIGEVSAVIPPVWPLQDYVAVNPYAGISHRSFLDARALMRVYSDCETLMPIEHYAAEFHQGRFTVADIELAIVELSAAGVPFMLSAAQVAEKLIAMGGERTWVDQPVPTANPERRLRTIAELATHPTGVNWSDAVVDEVSKHCAAHYDQGQATWSSPYANLSLYESWRTVAAHDRNLEFLGLSRFRKFVAQLPQTPEAAIIRLLQQLRVPQPLCSTFLMCQAFSVPGWSAWAKYQSSWNKAGVEKNDLTGLLAIRLAYDAALAEAQALRPTWPSCGEYQSDNFDLARTASGDDSIWRYALLRASEISYRNSLLESLSIPGVEQSPAAADRKQVQMVFCIDVRSERIRRQLESQSNEIETFGFAGFFGMAFDYVTIGEETGKSQLPVLLKPQFKLQEGIRKGESTREAIAISKRRQIRSWRSTWKSLETSAIGCFSFVETLGLFYGIKLLQRATGSTSNGRSVQFDGLTSEDQTQLGPTLRGLNHQGVTTSRQVDMAEGMLRNLGLTKDFARLVVFCGHACQTENNPLAAGLDCGACGGHSGEPNGRFAALLLNQSYIRRALAERGIEIPANTHFLGAVHNTTTDAIEFFNLEDVPAEARTALRELMRSCAFATKQTQKERMPIVASKSLAELEKRATDWSELRPEWGLAGNAAFIVAPRSVTKGANLDARSFLHSYDYTRDEGGKVLETIMTAPMIVANWINMQYYASTVDNQHFGSGTKTVHNVVGRFGILSGNGGDLMTGLPWQSLHTGDRYQHLPMRLQVVIAAPREMIDRVIVNHATVANLLDGAWLHLVAIDDGQLFRYTGGGSWDSLNVVPAASQ